MLLNHSFVAGGKCLVGPEVLVVIFKGITLYLLFIFLVKIKGLMLCVCSLFILIIKLSQHIIKYIAFLN